MPIRKSMKKAPVRRAGAESKEKMVSFGRAISNFFKKYFQFRGTATRAEYWWATLFIILVFVGAMVAAVLIQPLNMLLSAIIALMWVLFCVVIIVPMWSVAARRLHDAGYSAKILLVSLVFFVYSFVVPRYIVLNASIMWWIDWLSFFWGIIMLVLFVMPTKKQNNPYRD